MLRSVKRDIIATLLRHKHFTLANAVAHILVAKLTVDEALELLNLDGKDLSPATLKDAYRKAAMEYHPDRGGSVEKMQLVNEANDLLSKIKSYDSPSREDNAAKYAAAGKLVKDYLKKHIDPDVFTKHFDATTGKTFTAKVEEKVDTRTSFGGSVLMNIEWMSDDHQTAFDMRVWVNLSDIVWTKQLGGGDPDIGFKLMVMTAILHNNRKVKFKSRDWDITNRKSVMLDPKELFPPDKIAKMIGGKESARKFSRRDMLLALQKRLGAKMEQEWAYIPMGTNFTVVIYRSVMMRTPAWSPHSVYDNADRKAKWQTKVTSAPETDYTIDALVDLQKKAANVADGHKLSTMVSQTFDDLMDKWRSSEAA